MIFKIKINDNLLHYGLVSILLLMLLLFKATFSFAQIQKGQDINGIARDHLGQSVSMPDSITLAVGSYINYVTNSVGYVKVFRWNGSAWQQKGGTIFGESAGDQSARSISMPDSNTVAIGAPYNDGNGYESGHVRVFSWNGSSWQQKGADIDGKAASDYMGDLVNMPDSNTVAVRSNNGKQIQLYKWNGIRWKQKGNGFDERGASLYFSMPDSNTIAISKSKFNDGSRVIPSYIRVYSINDTVWEQKGNNIRDGEWHGYKSLSMPDSNTVVVSINNSNDSSRLQVYKWNGNDWQQKGAGIDKGFYYNDSTAYVAVVLSSIIMPDSNTLAYALNYLYNFFGDQESNVHLFRWNGEFWEKKGIDIFERDPGPHRTQIYMPNSNIIAVGLPGYNDDGRVSVYSFCSSTAIISPTACDSFISPSGKRNWKRSGSYKETILNAEGCDSIVSIDLTILNSTSSTDFITACDSFKWIDNVLYTSSTDTATFTLTNAAGCDSVVTLDLSITSVDTSIIKENDTLIANQSAATYQWLNCDSSFSEVSGENSQSFKPENSGSYACEITLNGCVDTTSCYRVTIASIEEEPLSFEFKIHPNPVGDFLSIEIGSLVQNASMRIRNVNGQLVYENSNLREVNNQVNVSNWAKGVYFVRIIGDDFDKTVKIVKQ